MGSERLQKIISRAGLASRREAEELIQKGLVTVNGQVAEIGQKADLETDHVKVRGKLITGIEEKRYILLNKPEGVVATVSDPEDRKTVIDLLKGVRQRVFPVGRLDYNSEGLLILTNDGDLANMLMHPKFGCVKIYHVKVSGAPDEVAIRSLRAGVRLDDGFRTSPCEIERIRQTQKKSDANTWFEVRLGEGHNQQIRKMFDHIGNRVMRLKRVAIGPVEDSRLPRGQWRDMSDFELRALKSALSRTEEPVKRPAPRGRSGTGVQTRGASKARGAKKGSKKRPTKDRSR